jgi:hypothetical protein
MLSIPDILNGLTYIIKTELIRVIKWRELQMMMMTMMSLNP